VLRTMTVPLLKMPPAAGGRDAGSGVVAIAVADRHPAEGDPTSKTRKLSCR